MKNIALKPIILAVIILLLALCSIALWQPEEAAPQPFDDLRLPVTVLQVEPFSYQPHIRLTGITQARWPSELKAQSRGRLVELDEDIEPSSLVAKKQRLAQIDTSQLTADLATGLSEIRQAELNLKREHHEQTVALSMLSDEKVSAYAKREPQIASAQAQLAQANKAYLSIEQQLSDASISAPFDAIVFDKHVSPGQFVEVGDLLFSIASSQSIDVNVPISEIHWQTISQSLAKPQISVIDRQQRIWPSQVRYIDPKVDKTTRQRQVVLSVAKPYATQMMLLPGQQVNVEIALNELPAVVKLPVSALTEDGAVWSVDEQQLLQLESVNLLQESNAHIWVTFDEAPNEPRSIVIYPIQTFLEGLAVSPSTSADEVSQ